MRLILLAFLLMAASADARTLIVNANGITLTQEGEVRRFAMLLTGDDGRVEAVLPRGAKEPPLRQGDFRLDAKGATLLPGFIDAHGHLMGLGFRLTQLDLSETTSLEDALARVADAQGGPQGSWLRGRGWNQVRWGQDFPTAADLDRVAPGRPVYLERVDGHAAWVNRAALKAAGITAATKDPPGGRILRDGKGEPTGILIDSAMALVSAAMPPPTPLERDRALAAALRHLAEHGVTGLHDMGVTPEDWNLYRALGDSGRLTARITAYAAGLEAVDAIAPLGPTPWLYDDRLRLQGVKLYADGALGSRGAFLKAPYADDPKNRGLRFLDDARLQNLMSRTNFIGYQLAIHAIGDAANAQVLDAFTEIGNTYGRRFRNRIEHAQILDPADIPRFAALGIIASVQPVHATSDRTMAEARLGPDRLAGAYAWNSLRKAGAALAFGSDAPVEPVNPFLGIAAAVTRDGWRMEEALPVEAALAGFTVWAARAGLADGRVGELVPGAWADFVLLDRNPLTAASDELATIRVLETWVAGARVFQRPAAREPLR
ncbi:MAG: amidohydrolase family protein [Sphingomonadaceae bacterium]